MNTSHSAIKLFLETEKNGKVELKRLFYCYINDKEVPLEERWVALITAPSSVTSHIIGSANFDQLPDDFVMYEGPCHAVRYQTITALDLVESAIDYNSDTTTHQSLRAQMQTVDISALKEELLAMNLSSFEYDW